MTSEHTLQSNNFSWSNNVVKRDKNQPKKAFFASHKP